MRAPIPRASGRHPAGCCPDHGGQIRQRAALRLQRDAIEQVAEELNHALHRRNVRLATPTPESVEAPMTSDDDRGRRIDEALRYARRTRRMQRVRDDRARAQASARGQADSPADSVIDAVVVEGTSGAPANSIVPALLPGAPNDARFETGARSEGVRRDEWN